MTGGNNEQPYTSQTQAEPSLDSSTTDTGTNTDTDSNSEDNDTPVEVKDVSEETNSTILKQLVERIETLENENDEIKDAVTGLEQTVQEFEKRITVLESRADHLNDGIESVEIELKQQEDDNTRKRETLKDRITALEAELGIDDFDAGTITTNASCELERLAQMPAEVREEEMSTNVNRAVTIWNHFDEWSKPVNNGQLLPSSEIRKLIGSKQGTYLEWVQIYRAMEAFNKNTPEEYRLVNPDNSGKSLIREYND